MHAPKRMHRANAYSPTKPVRVGHSGLCLTFVSFVTFVVKVFLRISFAPFTELSDFSHPTTH